jgi:hypothetical protein
MFGADKDESELSRAHSHDNHGSGEGAREGEASNGDDDASGDDDDVGGDDSGGGYPKEYLIWVCPPTGTDDYYPRYSCPDTTVYTGPGLCSACGANLEQISASDIDFYLATHELMA